MSIQGIAQSPRPPRSQSEAALPPGQCFHTATIQNARCLLQDQTRPFASQAPSGVWCLTAQIKFCQTLARVRLQCDLIYTSTAWAAHSGFRILPSRSTGLVGSRRVIQPARRFLDKKDAKYMLMWFAIIKYARVRSVQTSTEAEGWVVVMISIYEGDQLVRYGFLPLVPFFSKYFF